MAALPDPHNALVSFQQALLTAEIALHPCESDPALWMHVDRPNGVARFTYVRLDGNVVTAFVSFVPCDPMKGEPCFNVGYAVPERFRGQGRAKEVINAAVMEMRRGFGNAGVKGFYVEAIVSPDNLPSCRVAEQVISPSHVVAEDCSFGVPVRQYVLHVECK